MSSMKRWYAEAAGGKTKNEENATHQPQTNEEFSKFHCYLIVFFPFGFKLFLACHSCFIIFFFTYSFECSFISLILNHISACNCRLVVFWVESKESWFIMNSNPQISQNLSFWMNKSWIIKSLYDYGKSWMILINKRHLWNIIIKWKTFFG